MQLAITYGDGINGIDGEMNKHDVHSGLQVQFRLGVLPNRADPYERSNHLSSRSAMDSSRVGLTCPAAYGFCGFCTNTLGADDFTADLCECA